ncbi:molybdopterin molybdenumtransferase [bacterium BMS3Abin11]|nr:molybdopterin molybdenumtransferase [bacterium BMS3Abin11]
MSCCCSTSSSNLMPLDEALSLLINSATPVADEETVMLDEAMGRVLSQSVTSNINVPAWDNSAMDGYALCYKDIASLGQIPVSQRIPAGTTGQPLQPGTAARIFTGAPVPAGADTVIMQEMITREGEMIRINGDVNAGANIRRTGEDICQGNEIIECGCMLQTQHIGLAASTGTDSLVVKRKLRVAIFTTGDELTMPGQPLDDGKIYNSNRYLFRGLLEKLGCEVVDLGNVIDEYQATCDAINTAVDKADLILSSGGVSVGEEDYVKKALEEMGSLDLWKIAVRPGKPLAFGKVRGVPFIGVPGNPVSLFVTFSIFARPFILRSMGIIDVMPVEYMVVAGFDWKRPDKRTEYMRARLETNDEGQKVVNVYPSRSSGILSSVTWADGMAVINPDQHLVKGDRVRFIPFSSLY